MTNNQPESLVGNLLSWNVNGIKSEKIIEVLSQYNSDVICLQEVNLFTYDSDFTTFLNKYNYEFKRSIVTWKSHQNPNVKCVFGNVTMFKRNLFKCLQVVRSNKVIHCKLVKIEEKEELETDFETIITNVHFPACLPQDRLRNFILCRKQYGDLVAPNGLYEIVVKSNIILVGDFNDDLIKYGIDNNNNNNEKEDCLKIQSTQLYQEITKANFHPLLHDHVGLMKTHCLTRGNIRVELDQNHEMDALLVNLNKDDNDDDDDTSFLCNPTLYKLFYWADKKKSVDYCQIDICSNMATCDRICTYHATNELWDFIDTCCCRCCGQWFKQYSLFLIHIRTDCLRFATIFSNKNRNVCVLVGKKAFNDSSVKTL